MHGGGRRYIEYADPAIPISLYPFADAHLGNIGCDKVALQRDLSEAAAEPAALVMGIGDYAEYIPIHDRRFDAACIDPEVLASCDMQSVGAALSERVAAAFKPVAGKCIGLGFGNHEANYMKHADQGRLHEELCAELKVPNLGYCGVLDLVFVHKPRTKRPYAILYDKPAIDSPPWVVRIGYHHGVGSGRTRGGKIGKLVMAAGVMDADIIILAHTHTQLATPIIHIGGNEDCTRIVDRQQLAVNTGTYLRTYRQDSTIYGEMALYDPTLIGCTPVRFHPDKRKAEVSVIAKVGRDG